MMRLFVAVDMDEAVIKRLSQVQDTLRQSVKLPSGSVSWVRPEQMHLTLKFLGPVEDADVPRVCAMVQETAVRYEAFEAVCKGVGVFGSPARVVWAGVDGGATLKKMQHELDDRFTKAGWAAENRAFAAHLTLCRVKSAAAGAALAAATAPFAEEVFGNVWVDSVAVYESRLHTSRPEYLAISRVAMK